MSAGDELLEDSAEELFENAPCSYLSTSAGGTIVKVNRTFEEWTGYRREALLGKVRFRDLLTAGGRIYHETHFAPLLQMQGRVREVALDIVDAGGRRLPALVNAVVREDAAAGRQLIRITIFDATDRRRYEQELVKAREREHAVAHELQRSLLSGALPQSERLAIDVVYRPAGRGLEVGGDWYDAFWLRESRSVGIVVGDVVGRGIVAAATMGQLRSAVRALASTGMPPGVLLDALDHYVRRHEVGQMTTVAYAEVELDSRRVRCACAGQLPPAILEPGRPARLEWQGRSPPLDALRTPHPRPETAFPLAAGSTLVLYTDGLVERRDRPLDTSLDELLTVLDRVRDEPERSLVSAVAEESLERGGHDDDVCVLALHLPP